MDIFLVVFLLENCSKYFDEFTSWLSGERSLFLHMQKAGFLMTRQGRSNVFVIGAIKLKHRRCERECRRREAVLGVSGGMLLRKFFEKLMQFGAFLAHFLGVNFLFRRHYFSTEKT